MTKGESISILRPDGKSCGAYFATSTQSQRAVLVIQEWWGLNQQIKNICNRFAEAGFSALAPDLYHGELAKTADEASHKMNHLDFAQAVSQDITGAVQFLKTHHPKVAVLGFCMGGALTLLSALRVPNLNAAVCFYGIPPAEAGDLSAIKIPVLAHFAELDDWCSPQAVSTLESKFKAGHVPYQLYTYPAHHAFFNETRPEVYDANATQLAWQRTIEFLNKHML